MIHDVEKYIEDTSGNIYKIVKDHFLNLSPCLPIDKYVTELDTENYHIISYNSACMLINKQYNSIAEHWTYNNEHFEASTIQLFSDSEIEEHTFKIRLLPDHSVVLDDNGISELKLIRSKGKMYYILIINEKLPRVKAYDLFGRFVQWLGIKNCKPVWNSTKERFM